VAEVSEFACPALVMENKVDYGKFLWECPEDLEISRETRPAGSLLVSPRRAAPGVTLVSYGETARELAEQLRTIFIETDLVPELVVLQMIHPLDTTLIERSVARTGRLVIVEDGSTAFGIGGEIISRLVEREVPMRKVLRIGAEPVPIPSISSLELQVLPTLQRVLAKIAQANLTGPNA
jgi:pyruvate/2-oxoglutarate/acetoin dehydrogenase E1 component